MCMYTYRAIINRIVDGDTVDVDIDLGFSMWMRNARIRLKDLDAPEQRTRDLTVKTFGLAATARLEEMLPVGLECVLITSLDTNDKFGRILGAFWSGVAPGFDNQTVNDCMINEGHAVPYYDGSNRSLLAGLHEKNRQRLIAEGKVVI